MDLLTMAVTGGVAWLVVRQMMRIKELEQQAGNRTQLPAVRMMPPDILMEEDEPRATAYRPPGAYHARPLPAATPAKGDAWKKYLIMALCAIYIISPIDFIPDVIPVLGWGDDVIAAVIGLRTMLAKS